MVGKTSVGKTKQRQKKKNNTINSWCDNREVMISFLLLFTDNKITQWEDPRLQNPAITGPVSTAMVLFAWNAVTQVLLSNRSCLFSRWAQTVCWTTKEAGPTSAFSWGMREAQVPAFVSLQGQGKLLSCGTLTRFPQIDAPLWTIFIAPLCSNSVFLY